MKTIRKNWLRITCASLLLMLTACGGGDGGGGGGDLAPGEWDNTNWDQMTWQ